MDAVSLSDARRRFTEVADQAEEAPVSITRANGKTLVLMDAAELSSIRETEYLLASKANRESLLRSVAHFESGKPGVVVSPDDL